MDRWRQMFHIEPKDGWLNDPNGLSYFCGNYHIYYQHSPKSALGKTPRCWNHCSGESLFDLKNEGIVLSPTLHEDKNGVYSGSAIVDNDLLHIFYTGNVKEDGDYDYILEGRGANVIHVSTKDGQSMSEKHVLLRNADYPDFCSCHVRDPKVWKENNLYKMVLGARTVDDKGCVLIYHSENLYDWKYAGVISTPDFGYMWECPDFFKIGEKGILSISPQGLKSETYKYQNLFQSGYFILDGELENPLWSSFTEWDMGFDFYAPQTFIDKYGRRVLIAWMGMDCEQYTNSTIELGWQHCLTLQRELTVREDGVVLQNPVSEFTELRSEKINIVENKEQILSLPFEILGESDTEFSVNLDNKLELSYKDDVLKLEFNDTEYGGGRTVRYTKISDINKLRIIADMSSLEIYINDGEKVMTTRFYPENKVNWFSRGIKVEGWQLNGANYE